MFGTELQNVIFSCPEQLNMWPCPLVPSRDSLGPSDQTNNQSLPNTTEWSMRLVTFETFDQSDEETWPDKKELPTFIPTHLPTYLSNSCDVLHVARPLYQMLSQEQMQLQQFWYLNRKKYLWHFATLVWGYCLSRVPLVITPRRMWQCPNKQFTPISLVGTQ